MLRQILYISMSQPLALDFHKPTPHGPTLQHHVEHCLSYLRQGIMCSADPTVENLSHVHGKKTDEGWGNTHVCRDWSALKEYAELHQADNRTGLGVNGYIERVLRHHD